MRTIRKTIRFDMDEYTHIENLIDMHSISFAEFARNSIMQKEIKSKVDLDLIYEINKICNSLNKIAHYVNTNKVMDMQVLQMLVDIEKRLNELLK
jgi:formiminotetrahydrofolate cyclodeaminase